MPSAKRPRVRLDARTRRDPAKRQHGHLGKRYRRRAREAPGRAGQAAGVGPARRASRSSSSSRAATPPARAARSSASPSRSTRASAASSALPAPTEREKTQWYFQRYVAHLPAAGEIVLFDRSWYNRAGVERVMGFCTEDEYQEFLRSCPEFERMLDALRASCWSSTGSRSATRSRSGASRRRIDDPTKRWKLSPMDLESRARWVDYSKAKDEMFAHTDIKQAPWYVVDADDKKRARLNFIHHLLSLIPYEDLTPEPIALPPRQPDAGYVRPPLTDQTFVPEVY